LSLKPSGWVNVSTTSEISSVPDKALMTITQAAADSTSGQKSAPIRSRNVDIITLPPVFHNHKQAQADNDSYRPAQAEPGMSLAPNGNASSQAQMRLLRPNFEFTQKAKFPSFDNAMKEWRKLV
jgi:hypothetical protein